MGVGSGAGGRGSEPSRMLAEHYYADRLAGERLRRCYEVAPPRVARSLEAEIEFVLDRTPADARILELGCGYGRVLARLAPRGHSLMGIDTSLPSLRLARDLSGRFPNCRLALMDAERLALAGGRFDVVLCIQNGLSAFHADQEGVVRQACRVVRPGGMAVFSSYADAFWPQRLAWFRLQAARGLIGEIDEAATGDGVIVCRDGFRATTVRPPDFRRLAAAVGAVAELAEVDRSVVFCIMRPGGGSG